MTRAAYNSSVQVVRLGDAVLLPKVGRVSSTAPIEIVGPVNAFNKALKAAIAEAGGQVSIQAEPSGGVATVILTASLQKIDPVSRHWAVLQQACRAQIKARRVICLQYESPEEIGKQSGLMGLSRTLRKEWQNVDTVCWSLPGLPATKLSKLVLTALLADLGDCVLRTDGTYQSQVIGNEVNAPDLKPDTVGTWLVTGGARGVTADCAIELARRTGGTFILAGRSAMMPWPEGIEPAWDLKSLRALLAGRAKTTGEKIKPVELDRIARQSLAGQEIRQTLQSIADAGGRAYYQQLDLGNREGVATVLAAITAKHGALTGLVHGAGVLSDRLALKKTCADVEAVFGPKVLGLCNVINALDVHKLKHVGLFSSASAVFGNSGQAGYAMANEWLNQTAQVLARQLPDTYVKSFNWGPWDGGMVDATLAGHFAAQGIKLIGRADGARIFADQLLHGDRDEVELLIGDRWDAA